MRRMWPVAVTLLAIGALSGHRYLLILLAIGGWFVSWIEFAVASEAPVPREPETGFREAATGLPEPERPLFPPEVV
mgnify:CR=1 FL=1